MLEMVLMSAANGARVQQERIYRTCAVHKLNTVQSTSLTTTLGGASEKCPYSRSVVIPEVSLHVYVSQLDGTSLCSGYENDVVIRELSLYPQSFLAKLTVDAAVYM